MLTHLVIHNIVLIEKLSLSFAKGFCTLTGETGSGKSILLDALGLALGARAEQRFVRQGAEQASVSASFEIAENPACRAKLEELGLPVDDSLTIRRTLTADGKSKAFVQDVPVSVTGLRAIGDQLLEVHGQHEQRGLLAPSYHQQVLDAFGQLMPTLQQTRKAYRHFQELRRQLIEERERLTKLQEEEEYLRHVLKELEELTPQVGEEDELATARKRMMEAEQLSAGWRESLKKMDADYSPVRSLQELERDLFRHGGEEGQLTEEITQLLAEATDKACLARDALEDLVRESDFDPHALEEAEERLFALRAAARKHHCTVDELAEKQAQFAKELQTLDHQQAHMQALEEAATKAEQDYRNAAEALTKGRQKAAKALEKAVAKELAPLKLGNASFTVELTPLAEGQMREDGLETVQFTIATNPGSKPGPLAKVASGGELSRLMLALKVALADVEGVPSMVFDEVDTGIGGATAAAVGKRLALLAESRQVFVVTHQPQVAALADQHLHVSKQVKGGHTHTQVVTLEGEARREELARMLAGETITPEARAAAEVLLQGGEVAA